MAQDFLGSIAQEDVQFITNVVLTSTPGDNYWKTMVFIENTRFVSDQLAFQPVANTSFRVATVTMDTYMNVTTGLLQSWLFDLFANNNAFDVYLVQVADDIVADPAEFITALGTAYDTLKDYAYWKTVCAGAEDAINPEVAAALALLCRPDQSLLSSAPLYPYTTTTPEEPLTDPIYEALANADLARADAILTAHQDTTRNGSLYRLGQALSMYNASGTPVGNNFDYWASTNISLSGPLGTNLSRSVRDILKSNHIGFFKPVGDSTGAVAAIGVQTVNGAYIQALWIVNYINFMSKCMVARFLVQPNTLRNANSYENILSIMMSYLRQFGPSGSGRLSDLAQTAPSYAQLPASAGDELIIPNAWAATYTNQLHSVRVYGTLTIAE